MIQRAGAGVQAWLELVSGEAQRQAPIEEGTLRGSAYVEIDTHADGVDGATGFATVYARYQHEGLHFAHPRGGKAKFLEDPFKQHLPRYAPTIAAAIGPL